MLILVYKQVNDALAENWKDQLQCLHKLFENLKRICWTFTIYKTLGCSWEKCQCEPEVPHSHRNPVERKNILPLNNIYLSCTENFIFILLFNPIFQKNSLRNTAIIPSIKPRYGLMLCTLTLWWIIANSLRVTTRLNSPFFFSYKTPSTLLQWIFSGLLRN